MVGVLVNTATVIFGSLLGLLLKKGIPKRLSNAVMLGIGLCSIYIGVSGSLKGKNTLVLIISMVLGAIVGTLLDIDGKINWLGDKISLKYKNANDDSMVAQGFVTASLLFCVGAMTIVGSLESGITGDNTTIFTKSVLDFVSAMMLAASLGIGVLYSAVFVFTFQGLLVLLSGFLQPILTEFAIAEITCAGSVMILALGLNLIGITKIKVANYLPAIFFAPIICYIIDSINNYIA